MAVVHMSCLNPICPVNDGIAGICHHLGEAINNINISYTLGKAMEGMPSKVDEQDAGLTSCQ